MYFLDTASSTGPQIFVRLLYAIKTIRLHCDRGKHSTVINMQSVSVSVFTISDLRMTDFPCGRKLTLLLPQKPRRAKISALVKICQKQTNNNTEIQFLKNEKFLKPREEFSTQAQNPQIIESSQNKNWYVCTRFCCPSHLQSHLCLIILITAPLKIRPLGSSPHSLTALSSCDAVPAALVWNARSSNPVLGAPRGRDILACDSK